MNRYMEEFERLFSKARTIKSYEEELRYADKKLSKLNQWLSEGGSSISEEDRIRLSRMIINITWWKNILKDREEKGEIE